jgi:acetylornithine deacetylase/succinyl-diaminopimelate desuccinylase-like protein
MVDRTVLKQLITAAGTAALALQPGGLHAQGGPAAELDRALRDPAVAAAVERLVGGSAAAADALVTVGGIVSPSGQEHARAAEVAERMRRIGLADVRVDSAPNVIGRIPGRSGKAVVFVATLDDLATVAEHQRAAGTAPRIDGDRVVGPGTNTSLVTVAMLAAAEALVAAGFQPEHDLVFTAVAQEETGLLGMKQLYDEYRDRAIAFIDILGDGRSISYGAIGIHWWRVIATGPGGHSLSGGLPNVNQALGRAADRILQLPHPGRHADSRTIINIAVMSSGSVFNHKPETGWFSLDIRSLDGGVIAAVEAEVRSELDAVAAETSISLALEAVQLTPGGQIEGARESRLVRTSEAIARRLGVQPRLGDAGSSNMNVAVAGGTPAIGLGGERGGRRGFPDEWADIPTMMRTAHHILLLAAVLGHDALP